MARSQLFTVSLAVAIFCCLALVEGSFQCKKKGACVTRCLNSGKQIACGRRCSLLSRTCLLCNSNFKCSKCLRGYQKDSSLMCYKSPVSAPQLQTENPVTAPELQTENPGTAPGLQQTTMPTDNPGTAPGWLLIYQLTDLSYDWNLDWLSYKNGFGDVGGNYWMGLERMHQLTSAASYRLRVEIQQASNETWFFAEYSSFEIGDESNSGYKLNVSGYSGDAGDALAYNGDLHGDGNVGQYLDNGMPFTTKDSANNYCANRYQGGWWYNNYCFYACLTCSPSAVYWNTLTDDPHVKAARMMIKLNA